MQSEPMTERSEPKLIFVVGVWRSGTSLLHAMLNQHPQIGLMFEAEPFGLFPLKKNVVFPPDWAARLEFLNQAVSRHKLDPSKLPAQAAGRECLLSMFRTVAARKNAAIMGGKSPTYHAWLPRIAKIFPEADFIIIWRNPLDSMRSVKDAGRQNRFFGRRGIGTRTYFGSEQMFKGVAKLRTDGRRIHELLFADLVATPEIELRKICDFIGVNFDPRMLDLQSADFSMVPPGEHHEPLRSGLLEKKQRHNEVLPWQWIEKDQRYVKLWRERYAGSFFARSLTGEAGKTAPSVFEQGRDRAVYWWWRLWSRFKNKVIRRTPLAFWQQFRGEEPAPPPASQLNDPRPLDKAVDKEPSSADIGR
jgi:Sulfotransferase family